MGDGTFSEANLRLQDEILQELKTFISLSSFQVPEHYFAICSSNKYITTHLFNPSQNKTLHCTWSSLAILSPHRGWESKLSVCVAGDSPCIILKWPNSPALFLPLHNLLTDRVLRFIFPLSECDLLSLYKIQSLFAPVRFNPSLLGLLIHTLL